MNLPNRLTILRIILSFVFMLLLFCEGLLFKTLALLVFIIASVTDFFDGYIARKYNMITDLGKLLDPIADKILVLSAFIAFVEMRLVPSWMVVIIVFRELLITGTRFIAMGRGKVIAAAAAGKHKTVSQIVSIIVVLLVIIIKEAGVTIFSFWNSTLEHWTGVYIYILMLITVTFTLISGASYLMKNKNVFKRRKKHN